MKIFILGGYGNTGRRLARLLLEHTDCHLVLGGRNVEAARTVAAALDPVRVAVMKADAADPASLVKRFAGCGLVVSAAPLTGLLGGVVRAAIRAGAGYLDIGSGPSRWSELAALEAGIAASRGCAIGEAGFHPGLPAALVRYLAPHFTRLDRAEVGSVIRADWRNLPAQLSRATVMEFMELMRNPTTEVFRDGAWRAAPWAGMRDTLRMDFGEGFGRQMLIPWALDEMRAIPALYPSLRRTGFFIAGFNWFTDWFVLPLAAVAIRLRPRSTAAMGELLFRSLKAFSKPPFGTVLKLEAEGEAEGGPVRAEVTLFHAGAYEFTAIPAAACILQYLDGSIRRPGLWMMPHVVDPARLMRDMAAMGIRISGSVPPHFPVLP